VWRRLGIGLGAPGQPGAPGANDRDERQLLQVNQPHQLMDASPTTDDMPGVMARPQPTRYGLRSQAVANGVPE
jgi:hypothetical protein